MSLNFILLSFASLIIILLIRWARFNAMKPNISFLTRTFYLWVVIPSYDILYRFHLNSASVSAVCFQMQIVAEFIIMSQIVYKRIETNIIDCVVFFVCAPYSTKSLPVLIPFNYVVIWNTLPLLNDKKIREQTYIPIRNTFYFIVYDHISF